MPVRPAPISCFFSLGLEIELTEPRVVCAVIFLVNSVLSWIMLTPWALKKMEHLTLDTLPISCFGKQCWGFVSVQRINYALGVFHAVCWPCCW